VFLFLPVNVDLSIADLAFTMEFGRAEVVIASLVALLERGVEGVEDSWIGADTIPLRPSIVSARAGEAWPLGAYSAFSMERRIISFCFPRQMYP
jgi:hypothetical protein